MIMVQPTQDQLLFESLRSKLVHVSSLYSHMRVMEGEVKMSSAVHNNFLQDLIQNRMP